MRKLLALVIVFTLGVVFTACDDSTDPTPVAESKSVIKLVSTPAGAQIWRGTTNTGKVTPDSLTGLASGNYDITLKLENHKDTTFTVNVTGTNTVTKTITLTANPLLIEEFFDIQLFEREATGFSGLDLSTGTPGNSNGAETDIFLDGTGGTALDLKSQHLRTPAPTTLRYTDFYNNVTGTSLTDGVASFTYSSSDTNWTTKKPFTLTTYSFLYDNDLHYTKLKITATGGGTGPSDPYRWVKVSYKYNKTQKDRRF